MHKMGAAVASYLVRKECLKQREIWAACGWLLWISAPLLLTPPPLLLAGRPWRCSFCGVPQPSFLVLLLFQRSSSLWLPAGSPWEVQFLRDQRGVSDSAEVSSVYYDNPGGAAGACRIGGLEQ